MDAGQLWRNKKRLLADGFRVTAFREYDESRGHNRMCFDLIELGQRYTASVLGCSNEGAIIGSVKSALANAMAWVALARAYISQMPISGPTSSAAKLLQSHVDEVERVLKSHDSYVRLKAEEKQRLHLERWEEEKKWRERRGFFK